VQPFGSSVPNPFPVTLHKQCSSVLGLINNVLYVIILSAALDLVGPSVPKGAVLLCDVIPSFLTKLLAPYFIQSIPYSTRVILLSMISALGMLLIALTPAYTNGNHILTKMAGVILASLSSGGGELSFISLTHYYGPFSLAAWASGTGGAGLVGAGAYVVATTTLGLSSKNTLFASAFLPIVLLISFFVILPRGPLSRKETTAVKAGESDNNDEADDVGDHTDTREVREEEGLLSWSDRLQESNHETRSTKSSRSSTRAEKSRTSAFLQNLRRSRSLFFP